LPEGVRKPASASSGKTDVAKEGFQELGKQDDEDDAATAEISGGGLIASGNSRQLALTSSAKFRVRRGPSQVFGAGAANYAEAASETSDGLETTVFNLQGQLRYDYFFAERWAAFLSVTARRDRFQGLDLRLSVDPGIAYYLLQEAEHLLWFELGYDLQYDVRREEVIEEAREAMQDIPEETETRHNARAFAGYSNKLNERVTFETGLEYIQSVSSSSKWRLNWDASVTSNIAGRFSTAVSMNVRYDRSPLPGIERLDVMTSFNLLYTLM
jgi:putative salt-induced outer membrane protein